MNDNEGWRMMEEKSIVQLQSEHQNL